MKNLLLLFAGIALLAQVPVSTKLTPSQLANGTVVSGGVVITSFIPDTSLTVTANAAPNAPPILSVKAAGAAVSWGVVPQGAINGQNATFTLPSVPTSGEAIHVNGLRQTICPASMTAATVCDYLISGLTITFQPNSIPLTGDTVVVDYQ